MSGMRSSCPWALALIVAVSVGGTGVAGAQGVEAAVVPRPVPQAQEMGAVSMPAVPPSSETRRDDKAILPVLKGLRFVGSMEAVRKDGYAIEGLSIQDLPMLDDKKISARLAAFLGKPFSLAVAQDIAAEVSAWYREHDHPLALVTTPEQDIDSGVVQMVVTEFTVGTIKVSGGEWFGEEDIVSALRLEPGDVVDTLRLQEDLAQVNANPFRHVDAVLEKGSQPATTDVTLKTVDRVPVRVYAGYANNGSSATGQNRWSQGVNWGDAFGLGHQLSYQFTSSGDFWASRGRLFDAPGKASFMTHAVSYSLPVAGRDKVDLFGWYERSIPSVGADFGQTGRGGQASLRYHHALPMSAWLTQEIYGGYDFKITNNNLAFGGETVFEATAEVHQFLAGYRAVLTDPWGRTVLDNQFFGSPGNLSSGNTTAAFRQAGTGAAEADYVYDRLYMTRTTPLTQGTEWVMRAQGQVSTANLPSSEQLLLGGADSVRGYRESVAGGSQGVIVSQEFFSPALGVSRALTGQDIGDQGRVLAFYDLGSITDNRQQAERRKHNLLQSAGVGARYDLGSTLNMRTDYGWQLTKAPSAAEKGQFANISMTVGF